MPGYTVLSDEQMSDETQAKAALEAAGVVGAVVLRPVASDQEISSTPTMTMYSGPYYRGFWGGYYGYGWGSAWGTSQQIRTDTIVTIETLVYSLADNQLVWAGQSKTTNPDKVDSFVREIVSAAANEMKKQGLM